MKVLFVGNSHTFFNDMPELFATFVEKTTGEKPEVVMLAYGGRDYKWHRKEYFALRFNLMYGGYDYCTTGAHLHFGIAEGDTAYSFNSYSFNPREIFAFPKLVYSGGGYFYR